MPWDNYYDNDANNARMREEAARREQAERQMREDYMRNSQYQMNLINDQLRQDKFVSNPDYSKMAASAAGGYAFAWGLKQIFSALFGRRS